MDKFRIESLNSIQNKFKENHLKIETILEECSQLDVKNEGSIHPDDLIDILKSLLPPNALTRREFHYLILSLGGSAGQNVNYKQLPVLFPKKKTIQEEKAEEWHDEEILEEEFADYDGMPGSIGEWLHRRACPAEIQNYKILIACLERFERETGMRVSAESNGFDVPLGPDLRAKIKFHVR